VLERLATENAVSFAVKVESIRPPGIAQVVRSAGDPTSLAPPQRAARRSIPGALTEDQKGNGSRQFQPSPAELSFRSQQARGRGRAAAKQSTEEALELDRRMIGLHLRWPACCSTSIAMPTAGKSLRNSRPRLFEPRGREHQKRARLARGRRRQRRRRGSRAALAGIPDDPRARMKLPNAGGGAAVSRRRSSWDMAGVQYDNRRPARRGRTTMVTCATSRTECRTDEKPSRRKWRRAVLD